MTKTARSPRASARVIPLRRATTLEMVRLACPDSPQALRISESFGLAILDSDGIRDLHERLVVETAAALKDGLSDRAMEVVAAATNIALNAGRPWVSVADLAQGILRDPRTLAASLLREHMSVQPE